MLLGVLQCYAGLQSLGADQHSLLHLQTLAIATYNHYKRVTHEENRTQRGQQPKGTDSASASPRVHPSVDPPGPFSAPRNPPAGPPSAHTDLPQREVGRDLPKPVFNGQGFPTSSGEAR